MLNFRLASMLLIAELWFCHSKSRCYANFTECYNTTSETHCFSKIVNGTATFTDAQKRCSAIDATIPVIKNGDIQQLLETFISNLYQSGGIEGIIIYFWINAHRVVGTKWHWLNSSVINELSADIASLNVYTNHVASLAVQNGGQQDVFLQANYPKEVRSYICEFFGSDCKPQSGKVLQYGGGKCYVAYEENATWYSARNSCLNKRGDLASFGDLKNTDINFTQWLNLSSAKQYWVGVRLLRWTWNISDYSSEVRYTNWSKSYPEAYISSDDCVSVLRSGSPAVAWRTEDCNQSLSVGVICHKVTSYESSKDTKCVNCDTALKASTTDSTVIPLAVGIGLGVGIPVVIALIVIIIVCVRRKRKPHQNVATATKNTDDPQIDQTQHGKDNTTPGGVYWEVTKNDSATSGTEERSEVPASSESDAISGDKIVYSSVAFIEGGESRDDLP